MPGKAKEQVTKICARRMLKTGKKVKIGDIIAEAVDLLYEIEMPKKGVSEPIKEFIEKQQSTIEIKN